MLTLTASEIRRAKRTIQPVGEIETLNSKVGRKPDPRIVRHLFSVSLILLLMSLLLATPLFIFMPRPYSGWLGQLGGTAQNLSGFSDTVQLGDVANLKKNPQIVMHVKVEGAESRILSRLKWRGVALDRYEDNKWQNSYVGRTFVRGQPNFYSVDTSLIQDQTEYIKQTFYLEPLSTPVIFAAWRPLTVQGGLRRLWRDNTSSLYSDDHSTTRLIYSVDSDGSQPSTDLLRTARSVYPSETRRIYLQLPQIDPRVHQLALQITRGATNNYDRAKMIENYLRTDFAYTLEVPRTNEPDPLADFLFNTKKGYCQYFATAMAVMLRSIGIPSRVVNGFQTGDFNPMIDTFVVRQSDAHSWVEAYFPMNGTESAQWVEFDPTPAAGQSVYESGFLTSLSRMTDAIDFFWQEHVLSYDSHQQVKLWDKVEKNLSFMKENVLFLFHKSASYLGPMKNGESNTRTMILLGILLLVLGGTFFLLRKAGMLSGWSPLKWFSRFRGKSSYRESAIGYYNEMQQMLAQHGVIRAPGQTPLELALSTGFPEVWSITTMYNRIRFSSSEPKAGGCTVNL